MLLLVGVMASVWPSTSTQDAVANTCQWGVLWETVWFPAFQTATDKKSPACRVAVSLFHVCEMRADSNCVVVYSQWGVSFPLKPTPLSRATGWGAGGRAGGGGGARVGRQADSRPHPPTKAATNQTKRDGEHNTNSTMIGSDGSQSAVLAWSSIAFSGHWCWLTGGGRGDWGRGITETGGVRSTNIKMNNTDRVWLGLERRRIFSHGK